MKRKTKAVLIAEIDGLELEAQGLRADVEELRARVGAMGLEGIAGAHLDKLKAAAEPYEKRLALLPGLEAGLAEWDDCLVAGGEMSEEQEAAHGAALVRVKACRLTASESSALNQLYRQQADVLGILKRDMVRKGRPKAPAGGGDIAPGVPLSVASNVVKLVQGGDRG